MYQHASSIVFVLDEKRYSALQNTIPMLRWHFGCFDTIWLLNVLLLQKKMEFQKR
jgi:hypothetical protein